MPYTISKSSSGKYIVRKKDSGKVVATTDSAKNLRGVLWHREHGKGGGVEIGGTFTEGKGGGKMNQYVLKGNLPGGGYQFTTGKTRQEAINKIMEKYNVDKKTAEKMIEEEAPYGKGAGTDMQNMTYPKIGNDTRGYYYTDYQRRLHGNGEGGGKKDYGKSFAPPKKKDWAALLKGWKKKEMGKGAGGDEGTDKYGVPRASVHDSKYILKQRAAMGGQDPYRHPPTRFNESGPGTLGLRYREEREKHDTSKKLTMKQFINEYRGNIDAIIKRHNKDARIDDREREMWVNNHEFLYNVARARGVKI